MTLDIREQVIETIFAVADELERALEHRPATSYDESADEYHTNDIVFRIAVDFPDDTLLEVYAKRGDLIKTIQNPSKYLYHKYSELDVDQIVQDVIAMEALIDDYDYHNFR